MGRDISEKLIKGYTEKQWGPSLPRASRLNNSPSAAALHLRQQLCRYLSGYPKNGYTDIVRQLLEGCEVRLDSDYDANRINFRQSARKIIYTDPVDAYFNFCFGPLEYRSLRFSTEILGCQNYQSVAVMNFTDRETPYTRIIEHKHFDFGTQSRRSSSHVNIHSVGCRAWNRIIPWVTP